MRASSESRAPEAQSLVTDKIIEVSRKKTLRILTLTKTGQRLLAPRTVCRRTKPPITVWQSPEKPNMTPTCIAYIRRNRSIGARRRRTWSE